MTYRAMLQAVLGGQLVCILVVVTTGVCVTVDRAFPKQKLQSTTRYTNFERYAEDHATELQGESTYY